MAHNIETFNGQAAFVSARVDAWHQLGVTLPGAFTAEEAMTQGYLGGWNVRKEPIFAGDAAVPVPDTYAVLRDNPFEDGRVDALGVVGDAYRVMQNEELAQLLNTLVDESGAIFETAGSLDGGRKVFITMKLPGNIQVGGVDPVDLYIAAMNSHDGNSATHLMVTPIRVVCQNTLNLAVSQSRADFKIRHTSGASRLVVSEARKALDLTFGYLDGFQEEAERMINTELTEAAFAGILERSFGVDAETASPATVTRTNNKIDEMLELFNEAYTQDGIRETVWAGLNSLTEWSDHFAPVRPGDSDEDDARARRALLAPTFKQKAWDMMTALV